MNNSDTLKNRKNKRGFTDILSYIKNVMIFTQDYDQLKVKFIGDYYSLRFSKEKTYFAKRDLEYGMLHIVDDLGEEGSFLPEEFEVVKVLRNGGLPDEDDSGDVM